MFKVLFLFLVIVYSFSSFSLSCNISNYKNFIYDDQKTNKLIEQTGKGCNLRGAKIIESDLSKANLQEADLRWSDLRKTDLNGANLYKARFYRADLRQTDFSEADLVSANFREANLREASFFLAKLSWVDLRDSSLQGVNFTGSQGHNINFRGAFYDDYTNLPGFDWLFNPEEEGMIYKD